MNGIIESRTTPRGRQAALPAPTKPSAAPMPTGSPAIPLDPLMTIAIEDREVDLKGWVAIHTLGDLGGCGGIRCAPDITLDEVRALARAMTYKYSFFRQPLGGAKGGMVMDIEVPAQRRAELVTAMGRHLIHILQTQAYHAWSDMNFSVEDVARLYTAANLPTPSLNDDSSQRTARSTFAAIVATADALGLAPGECRVSIEGLGSVGGYLAKEIQVWGGKLIAVSNVQGAIVNERGLDVDELLRRRSQQGSWFVREAGDWRNIERAELFDAEVDVLVPCARVGNIDDALARRIRAKAVAPAANVPCTVAAEQTLRERQIPLLPDFVVNAGGILGSVSHVPGDSFFMGEFKQMLDRLMAASLQRGVPPIDLARQVSEQHYQQNPGDFFKPKPRWQKIVHALRGRGWLPQRAAEERARQRQHLFDTVARITF